MIATRGAAEALGMEDERGSLQVGLVADLVILVVAVGVAAADESLVGASFPDSSWSCSTYAIVWSIRVLTCSGLTVIAVSALAYALWRIRSVST